MRLASACWLAVVAVLLVGCGGKKSPSSNGVESMTPGQILAQVQKAVADAESVHIVGAGTSGGSSITLDLMLAAGKGGTGHISIGGLGFEIVRVDQKLYFKGDSNFLNHYAGPVAAQLLAGKWFYVPVSSNGFGSFSPLTDMVAITKQILASHGELAKGSETTIDGQPAITLTDKSRGGTLYVATTGPAYPLALKPGKGKGEIKFTDWDQPVTLTAPSKPIDYSKLSGG
jgi:hypothetical protein